MEETLIDRIERYLAEFIQGMKEERAAIAELRESQKKTDEQIEKTSKKVEEVSKKTQRTRHHRRQSRGISVLPEREERYKVKEAQRDKVISRKHDPISVPSLTRNGEGGAMLVNRKNFRTKEF